MIESIGSCSSSFLDCLILKHIDFKWYVTPRIIVGSSDNWSLRILRVELSTEPQMDLLSHSICWLACRLSFESVLVVIEIESCHTEHSSQDIGDGCWPPVVITYRLQKPNQTSDLSSQRKPVCHLSDLAAKQPTTSCDLPIGISFHPEPILSVWPCSGSWAISELQRCHR